VNRPRGLCWVCYYTPGLKEGYGAGKTKPMGLDHEPTEAELDALIAEQMKPENLPGWWDAEEKRNRGW
jgi:hypothetical protein